MALALVGFMELHMRQSPMNGTDYAEIVAMRCEHGMTLPEMAVMSRRPLEVLSRSLARDMKRASDDVPDDWPPGSVNHVDRILDERPLRATSRHSITAHYANPIYRSSRVSMSLAAPLKTRCSYRLGNLRRILLVVISAGRDDRPKCA